ncbi:hypothetical protein BRADI_1g03313v3 [Brachypodium distachyon]|uniref:NAC domain-containing protein n=1 Tax=Brachypodium distachyon TaxID=15368 RepID=A0A0Q3KMN3_BRADI|nr:hypothetical protein BRADI_1g03313v3 [Brachypodium distachyon]
MAAADDGLDVPPGFESRFFHDADVYSAEPEKLVQPFLPAPGTGTGDKSPPAYPARYAGKKKSSGRRSRTIDGDGSKNWHSEKMAQPVEGGSAVGGCVQKLSYMVKNEASGKSERAGWIMAEYGISPEHGGGRLVLCKVCPSTYSHKLMAAEDSPGIKFKKRKAAAGDHPEADCFGIADPVPETERAAADYGHVDHQVFGFWQAMEQEFEASYPIPDDEVVEAQEVMWPRRHAHQQFISRRMEKR